MADSFDGLCLALGEESLCFQTEVCNADSQWTTLQAWTNIHKLDAEAGKLWSIYQHARQALKSLNIDLEYLKTLHDITEDDLKVSGDLTDKRQFGQWSDALPWFWMIGEPVGTTGS